MGDLTSANLSALLKEAAELEAGQVGHFTTALSDTERRYLDIMAEVFRRGELPACQGHQSEGCGERCGCLTCVIARAPAPSLLNDLGAFLKPKTTT